MVDESYKTVDRIFMVLFFIVGIMLFVMVSMSINKISKKCTSHLIKYGLTVMLVMATVLITSAISYSICSSGAKQLQVNRANFYLILSFCVSLPMAILTVIMIASLKKNKCAYTPDEEEDGKTLRFNLWFMFGLYVLISLLSGGATYYLNYMII